MYSAVAGIQVGRHAIETISQCNVRQYLAVLTFPTGADTAEGDPEVVTDYHASIAAASIAMAPRVDPVYRSPEVAEFVDVQVRRICRAFGLISKRAAS